MTEHSTSSRGAPHIVELGSRSEATRRAILDGALRIFARIGFEAASTRVIAAEAGVHHASLRYHYSDKEDLWRAAIRYMFERQGEIFSAEQQDSPIDPSTLVGLKEMVRRYIRYSAAHPEHAQILVHEAIADTDRLDWAVSEFVRANSARMGRRIEQHTEAGRLRLSDPRMTGIILSAASQMTFVLAAHLRRVYDEDVARPDFVERFADSMITLLFND